MFNFSALDHVQDLEVVNLEVHLDLGLDLNLEVRRVVVLDLDLNQAADLVLVVIPVHIVVHVREVILLRVIVQGRLADLDLVLLLVLSRPHDLVVNLSQHQDHQLGQSLVVVLDLIHLLVQKVGLHQIHLLDRNLLVDLLLDPGKDNL